MADLACTESLDACWAIAPAQVEMESLAGHQTTCVTVSSLPFYFFVVAFTLLG
jgi:hypothetical protein